MRANQVTYDFDIAAGLGGSTHPDSLSVLVALEPEVVTLERYYGAAIECEGELTRGATVFDWRAAPKDCNATAIEAVDGDRLFAAMLEVLRST